MTSTSGPRGRTDPERFDLYTRWSLYLLLFTTPLLGVGAVDGLAQGPAVRGYLLGLVLEAAVAARVTALALRRFLAGARVPAGWYLALGLVAAAGAGTAALAVPPAEGLAGRAGAVAVPLGVALMALAPVLRTRWLVLGTLAVAGAAAASFALPVPGGPDPGVHPLPAAISITFAVGGIAASFRLSAWMLGVVWAQERMRTVHARLAVAEERLRFSRDLHDVVGRTLSGIAMKSELAAELARRGHDGAVEQMLEVRGLAQDALQEVRGVVAGYRAVDLATELDGARSVLRSAGVSTRVIGEGTTLPAPVQQALAWVVREAVTNVVRHARPGSCTIDLDLDREPDRAGSGRGDVARLRIVNDGAGPDTGPGTGSGLIGLRERLAAVGGELSTSAGSGTFTLTATVPLTAAPRAATGPAADGQAPTGRTALGQTGPVTPAGGA
ncbi:sensor histidine kinase [Georgenia sp. TF02-10]|uniref:sensor histidine kinase n=1 Tax=Georgenia sp. TF02-10 TaxID=2917725 RepID=UPI001FA6AF37|nr:sensor histidine kinase [Georgenia sp. TF02-10]UNX54793.1 sensor histidine kinase [Georgenia sp. TF02-10]